MSMPDMNTNELQDRAVTKALDEYSEALRSKRLSAELEARIEAAIGSWAAEHRSRSMWRRPLPWVVAAASVAVITGGIALLVLGQRIAGMEAQGGGASETSIPDLAAGSAVSPLSTGGQVSLFPAEGAVFRVRANLTSAVIPDENDGERQYWVDVRIANDGTMRIMQVLPAERTRVVPRQ
jgi:hypothetical protein